MRYLTTESLMELRRIGDPEADACLARFPGYQDPYADIVRMFGFAELTEGFLNSRDGRDLPYEREDHFLHEQVGPPLRDTFKAASEMFWEFATTTPLRGPTDDELEALDHAADLFRRYGNEIASALLLAALPDAFAAEGGAKVLAQTRQLASPDALRRRVRGTAQFLMLVLAHDTAAKTKEKQAIEDARWTPNEGRCWRAVVALRLYHASIRAMAAPGLAKARDMEIAARGIAARNPAVINQEDLLGMLLGFSIGTLDVLDRFGIRLTDDERDDYLTAWNYIGMLLGVASAGVTATLGRRKTVPPEGWALPEGCELPEGWVHPEGWLPHDWWVSRPEGWVPPGGWAPLPEWAWTAVPEGWVLPAEWVPPADWVPLPIGWVPLLTDKALLPAACLDAKRLFDQIRKDVWEPIEGMNLTKLIDSTDDGRRLIVAMLEDLRASMPKFAKELPQLVMRELVEPEVRKRLALGDGGLIELGYTQFLQSIEKSPIGRTYGRGTLTGPALRLAANFVTRTSIIDFLEGDGPPFVIPGLEDWVEALNSHEQRPLDAKRRPRGAKRGLLV